MKAAHLDRQPEPVTLPGSAVAPLAIELRHLRYFVALADAGSFGLGWLTAGPEALPSPLDVMGLAEWEPDVWIPSAHVAARRGTISLAELVRMDVIYGPRRAEPGTYDAWTRVLQGVEPRFEFSDPPLRHSLQMNLAFAATADRATAVLTGPSVITGSRSRLIRPVVTHEMARLILKDHPLTATAALVWSGDLPRALQQILFDTAESITSPGRARQGEPELKALCLSE
jgi:DNA-binding transcriptional LysR family regulator